MRDDRTVCHQRSLRRPRPPLDPGGGRVPADPRGRLFAIAELTSHAMSAKEFAELKLKPFMNMHLQGMEHLIIGDPAGSIRSQVDSRSVFQELKSQGLKAPTLRDKIANTLHELAGPDLPAMQE